MLMAGPAFIRGAFLGKFTWYICTHLVPCFWNNSLFELVQYTEQIRFYVLYFHSYSCPYGTVKLFSISGELIIFEE